ncbi:hypothetical protein L1987_09070 [Smallanthus sonchifolius]|uniref:Uncharacterized protein n=1 Tax=Smallanthus sonchifolius TaxID=185202 RepID=A0ACB9JPM7_9ASTR|nr:hypothetical protein L1987_09070 [Smallanthus sonchifolius]
MCFICGIEDNDNEDDGDDGDDGNAGNISEARVVKETIQDEKVNKEAVQNDEAPADNIQVESQVPPVTNERVEVENLNENVNKAIEDEVIEERE